MRNIALLILMLFLANAVRAQNVSIENGIDQIGSGYNPSLRVKIPHTEEKSLLPLHANTPIIDPIPYQFKNKRKKKKRIAI